MPVVVARISAKRATQKDLDNGLRIESKAIVDVEWLDACFHMNVEKLHPKQLLTFLSPTHTFGKVVAQDSNVICVATNESSVNGVDIIAIPIRWIESVKIIMDSCSIKEGVN